MDISIIIVTWQSRDFLKENLLALEKATKNLQAEIFVVDNNSGDGTDKLVSQDFPELKLILNKTNLGFAKANNQALSKASGEFILLLNPDMRLEPDTLDKMLAWARANPQAVVSTCRLESETADLIKVVRRFPRLRDQLAIILKLPHLFPKIINNYLQVDFDYSRASPVDSIRGSFFLINRKSWQELSKKTEINLDEQYFIWFEEVDFCRQVIELGGQVYYSPVAKARDYIGQSFKQVKRLKKQDYFQDSMLKYFKKWHKPWEYLALSLVWPLGKLIARIKKD